MWGVVQNVQACDHPFRETARLRLALSLHGVQPLAIDVERDPELPLGSVYAFDVTQTEPNGRRGGIRGCRSRCSGLVSAQPSGGLGDPSRQRAGRCDRAPRVACVRLP